MHSPSRNSFVAGYWGLPDGRCRFAKSTFASAVPIVTAGGRRSTGRKWRWAACFARLSCANASLQPNGITTTTIVVRYESREARDTARRSGMEYGMAAGYDRLEELLPKFIGGRT